MKRLLVVGAGGFGRELHYMLRRAPQHGREWTFHGFLDANSNALAERNVTAPILGDPLAYEPRSDDLFVLAISDPHRRRVCAEVLKSRGAEFLTFVDATVRMLEEPKLGEGCVLCMEVGISCGVKLGDFVIINSSSTVGHDARLGSYVTVGTNVLIPGNVRVGEATTISGHATFVPGIEVEPEALIGLGAVVVRRVRRGTTVFGNPARVISRRLDEERK